MCKRLVTLWIAALSAAVGCNGTNVEPASPPAGGAESPDSTAASAAPDDGAAAGKDRAVMAYVNGKPIYMETLQKLLLRSHGLKSANQLIGLELVRQAAEKANITITDRDVENEIDRKLKQAFGEVLAGEQRERMLKQLLTRFNIPRPQWELSARMNAYLAKLAAPRITVSDTELRDEFGRQFDRKVVVSHIETATLIRAQQVLKDLEAGADFAKLAFKHSTNPSGKNGGLLPPIGAKTEGVPRAIKQVALAMKSVGELSDPIQVGTTFHILKLEKIIPPQNARLADVKDKLDKDIRERKLRQLQPQILRELIGKTRVEFADPILKGQSDKNKRSGQ